MTLDDSCLEHKGLKMAMKQEPPLGAVPLDPSESKPLVRKELFDAMQANTKSTERERYFRHFVKITEEMFATTKAKNNDYGGADDPFKNFREFEELGILVRMSDKFARLKTALLDKRDFAVTSESIDDTTMDLAVYSVILLAWRRMKAEDEDRKSRKS